MLWRACLHFFHPVCLSFLSFPPVSDDSLLHSFPPFYLLTTAMLQRAVAVLLLAACASFAAAELNGAWTRLNELGGAVRAATSALSGSSSSIAAEIKTFNLTMRDGVKLWTRVADLQKPGRYPTVLIRSPYGPTGTENLDDLYLPFGECQRMHLHAG